jgi:hypothetical protein
MPIEKLLIYLVLGAIFFAKFVADTLKRQREVRTAEQNPEHSAPAGNVRGWEPAVASAASEARRRAAPLPERPESASSAVRAATRKPAARPTRKARIEPALRHRVALGEPAELRRAVELMAILGPPRSLVPYE